MSSSRETSQLRPFLVSISDLGLGLPPFDLVKAGVAEGCVDLLLVDRSGSASLLPAVSWLEDSAQKLWDVCVALLPVSREHLINIPVNDCISNL